MGRMPEEIDVETLGIEETYNLFIAEINKGEAEDRNLYKKVRYGIAIEFDIHYYLEGNIRIIHKKEVAVVCGRIIPLSEFWTEMEERTRLMKKWLLEKVKIPSPLEAG